MKGGEGLSNFTDFHWILRIFDRNLSNSIHAFRFGYSGCFNSMGRSIKYTFDIHEFCPTFVGDM